MRQAKDIRHTTLLARKIVVLVHGFGGDLDNWLFNIDSLARKTRVYALDLPGHGRSTKALGEPSLAKLSQALTGFMDSVGIDSAHLVGHSKGGAVALRTALDAAERVKSLILISSAGLGVRQGRRACPLRTKTLASSAYGRAQL